MATLAQARCRDQALACGRATTKLIEGTFDLGFENKVLCR